MAGEGHPENALRRDLILYSTAYLVTGTGPVHLLFSPSFLSRLFCLTLYPERNSVLRLILLLVCRVHGQGIVMLTPTSSGLCMVA